MITICFTCELVLADQGENIFDIIARINHHGFVRDVIANDRAITLQRPDRKDFVDHRT